MIAHPQSPQKSTLGLTPEKIDSPLFLHKKNADLYWKALIEVARGNKKSALKIIHALENETSCPTAASEHSDIPQNIDAYFDNLFLTYAKRDPQLLSSLGLFELIGMREHNAYLNDISLEAAQNHTNEIKKQLKLLESYNLEDLSETQKISYKIVAWKLAHAVEDEQFLLHHSIINQLDGILMELTFLLTQYHPIERECDVQHYISRLKQIPQQFDQAIDIIKAQQSKGILPPRFTVEKVITLISALITRPSDTMIFYTHLKEKINTINLENKNNLLKEALDVIENAVYPAYKKLQTTFTDLLEAAQANNGMWSLPNGDAYYAHMLKYHTTTDLSPEEIYTLGLQEVETIHKKMRDIFMRENLNDPAKSIAQLLQEFAKNPTFYYPDSDAGRKQCLTDFEAILERSRKDLSHLFGVKPKAGVAIQQVAPHEQEGAPFAYYLPPNMDGSRAGIFFVNVRNMTEIPNYQMETLTIHEAEPGHHFHLALQREMNMPIIQKISYYNAFIEGWALYAEKLAYEHKFYSSPASEIGHLQDELLRAARLVVDTGIHYKCWTREQAIVYMQEATGYHHDTVVTEVERYFVLPGQACSYKIGQLKILELRDKARNALGDLFDIKDFHTAVLSTGTAPLTVLEEVIDAYIKEKLDINK